MTPTRFSELTVGDVIIWDEKKLVLVYRYDVFGSPELVFQELGPDMCTLRPQHITGFGAWLKLSVQVHGRADITTTVRFVNRR